MQVPMRAIVPCVRELLERQLPEVLGHRAGRGRRLAAEGIVAGLTPTGELGRVPLRAACQ